MEFFECQDDQGAHDEDGDDSDEQENAHRHTLKEAAIPYQPFEVESMVSIKDKKKPRWKGSGWINIVRWRM